MSDNKSQHNSLFLLRVIFRHKYIVALLTIFGTAITFWWVNSLPDEYLASTKIMITPSQEDVELVRQYRPNAPITSKELLLTETEYVRSMPLISQALKQLRGGMPASPKDTLQTIIEISKNISVVPIRNTTMFRVLFADNNPTFAASFLNALASVYKLNRMKGEPDQIILSRYDRQIAGARSKLDSLYNVREDMIAHYSLVNPEEELKAYLSIRMNLQQEYRKLLYDFEDIKFKNEYLKKWLESDFSQAEAPLPIIKNGRYNELISSLNNEIRDLDNMRQEYTENYPPLVSKKENISRLLKRIKGVIESLLQESLSKQYAIQQRLSMLKTDILDYSNKIDDMSKARDYFSNIDNAINNQQAIYNAILMKREELLLSKKSGHQNFFVSVIEPAIAPPEPVGPRRMMSVLVSFFAYFFASIGMSYIIDLMNRKYLSPEAITRDTGLPIITSVFLEK